MPKLWEDTIDGHRQAVRDATLDTAAALVAERGLRSVTMSEIAERVGIGRATLYKYFPDVDAILATWHERQINTHLEQLEDARDSAFGPEDRLRAVLERYAVTQWQRSHHHSPPFDDHLTNRLHQTDRVAAARNRLHGMIRDLIAEAAGIGSVRGDIAAHELAAYAIGALGAANRLPSRNAVVRLVEVTLAGMGQAR